MESIFALPTLELSKLADEELVVLVRLHDHPDAGRELMLRYYPWVNRYVGRCVGWLRIGPVEWEDARQDAVLGIPHAIEHYDLCQRDRPRPARFCTYLRRVVRNRLRDFLRHHRRVENHYDRSAAAAALLHPRSEPLPAPGQPAPLVDHGESNPVKIAQWREELACLDEALNGLDEPLRSLGQGLKQGMTLEMIAAKLGRSYDAVRHLNLRLVQELRVRLRSLLP